MDEKYVFPEENVKTQNNVSKLSSISTRLGEYLIFVGTAGAVIYFVFKSIFGSPVEFRTDVKQTLTNTKYSNAKLDTVVEAQNVIYQELQQNNEGLVDRMNDNNTLLKQTNLKLDKMIRLMREKQVYSQPKPTYQYNPILSQPKSYDKSLDDYFKQRQLEAKPTLIPQKKN
jgi:hypothetical protein